MRVLGLDTATWTASVGLIDGDTELAERSLTVTGSHARTLLPMIEETLAAARLGLRDLELLAVSIGPGSFTGLRIGLSVAKGLAWASGIPLVGVPTLEALAHVAAPRPGLICPVLDARKREVYGAAFRWVGGALECVAEADVLSPEQFAARLTPPCTLVGDGVDTYASVWRACLGEGAELVPFARLSPRGSVVARLGTARFRLCGPASVAQVEPLYMRKSEAELRRQFPSPASPAGARPARPGGDRGHGPPRAGSEGT